jgi:D-glycero-beta-D-manno-heptose 1-phosphate adenylyltransferase
MPERERAEIVAALESVDYVVVFDGHTATDVVAAIEPTLYVKGGDYSADPADASFPPEGRAVMAYGGKIAIIPYQVGHSTSSLIDALGRGLHTRG